MVQSIYIWYLDKCGSISVSEYLFFGKRPRVRYFLKNIEKYWGFWSKKIFPRPDCVAIVAILEDFLQKYLNLLGIFYFIFIWYLSLDYFKNLFNLSDFQKI